MVVAVLHSSPLRWERPRDLSGISPAFHVQDRHHFLHKSFFFVILDTYQELSNRLIVNKCIMIMVRAITESIYE